jgi:4-amino-4-deoxy-L-arabinose transferase-like glycosyltransferase
MSGAETRVRRLRRWRPDLRPHHAVLFGILGVALGLRLWSIDHGLPWVFNTDEEHHFVYIAVQMVSHHTLDPGYFTNPPALSYLLGLFFTLGWIRDHPGQAFANDSQPFFLLGRIVVALVGTLLVYLVYRLGRRYDSIPTGLVAAGVMAVSFIVVWYSKQALDDAVAVTPAVGAAILAFRGFDGGRRRDFVWAGALCGLAAATKYPSGAMIFSVCAAVVLARDGGWRPRLVTILLAGVAAAVAFLIFNPYALIHHSDFLSELRSQNNAGQTLKAGAHVDAPWRYYLWSFTWGVGWVASLTAVAGAVIAVRENWRRFVILVTGPLIGVGFLALYDRAYGRYALPIYPLIAVLAALAAVRLASRIPASRALRTAVLVVFAIALTAESSIASVRLDRKLAREDSRTQARDWLLAHVPLGTRIAAEPVWPDPMLAGTEARRLYNVLQPLLGDATVMLTPSYIDAFRASGTCWVVTQNTWTERALDIAPAEARAFQDRLQRESDQHVSFSPWKPGKRVALNFDWSFDYYPDAFVRPGTQVDIYHLKDCTASQLPPLQDDIWH